MTRKMLKRKSSKEMKTQFEKFTLWINFSEFHVLFLFESNIPFTADVLRFEQNFFNHSCNLRKMTSSVFLLIVVCFSYFRKIDLLRTNRANYHSDFSRWQNEISMMIKLFERVGGQKVLHLFGLKRSKEWKTPLI